MIARRPRSFARPAPRGAFTLVELMVVIGIIVLLVGLTITVSAAVSRQSKDRQVQTILKLLDVAVTEWESAAGRPITWGTDGNPSGAVYDLQESADPSKQLSVLYQRISATDAARTILAQIDPDRLRRQTPDEPPELRDPWDHPIYLIHPGRVADPSVFPGDLLAVKDIDGTIRTEAEKAYGIAEGRRILFVSAGPDGEFGNLDDTVPEHDPEPAADNVYSFPRGQAP